MNKRTKENAQVLLIVIVILEIVLIFIVAEFIQKLRVASSISPAEVLNTTVENIYSSISTTPKNTDSSTIRKVLTEIFTDMNDRNFDKLYTKLTSDVKSLFFPTKEDFINYMEAFLADEKYSPSFSEYKTLNNQDNDVFIVKVKYIPYSTSENNILDTSSSATEKKDTFTIYMTNESSYTFSFMSFIGAEESENKFSNEKFEVKLKKTELYTSQTTFYIELTNKLDTDILIDDDGIYCFTGILPKYYSYPVTIPANSTITIPYTIYTGLNLKESLPKEIYFKGVRVNDKVHMFTVPISYPVKTSSL